ncbi:MAG: two-component system response regulator [Roseiarcus sp.]
MWSIDMPPRILVVDDEPINVKILVDLLKPTCSVIVAKSGEEALERLQGQNLPDLALLDVTMPGMDGFELCCRLKADKGTADIPVIFVTALGEPHSEARGFEIGAVDYINKPFSPPLVLARVQTHLALRKSRLELERQNERLEEAVAFRTQELETTQDVTIRALTTLAETRDDDTGAHILRTQQFVRRLAEELRNDPNFANELNDRAIDLMFKSAPLHDIGKVGIPDHILLKPGKLTPEEFEVMKTHVELGRRALVSAIAEGGATTEFLRCALEIIGGHHEKWDGTGYPKGLSGDEIPLSARIMAVADVYDALTSRRIYKPAFAHEVAEQIILEGKGRHFDPRIVDAFSRCISDFRRISEAYADPTPDSDALKRNRRRLAS